MADLKPYIWYVFGAVGAALLAWIFSRLSLRLALRYRPGGRIILEWQIWRGLITIAREVTLKNVLRHQGRFLMEVTSATILTWRQGRGQHRLAEKRVNHRIPMAAHTWPSFSVGGRSPSRGMGSSGGKASGGVAALGTMVEGARWLHFSWVSTIGTGDAALTARVAGAAWTLKGSAAAALAKVLGPIENRPRLEVRPDYRSLGFTTAVDCILALRLRDIIRAALQVIGVWLRDRLPAVGRGRGGGGGTGGETAGVSGSSQHKGVAKWKGTPSRVS